MKPPRRPAPKAKGAAGGYSIGGAVTIDLERVLAVARDGRLARSFVHGERHWKAVSLLGLDLCREVTDADPAVVFLFGLLHDCRRETEYHDDPEHGLRAACLVDELAGDAIELDPPRLRLLRRACHDHTNARRVADPTLAVCLDADRLNLWRCGITPSPVFLSTRPACERRWIELSRSYHLYAMQTWRQLARRACR